MQKFPTFSQNFILDLDASGNGPGTVLSQDADSHKEVVAHTSKPPTKAEKKYYATRKELLAFVWGVHHFHPHLLGPMFIPRTDNNSLKGFATSETPIDKLPTGWKTQMNTIVSDTQTRLKTTPMWMHFPDYSADSGLVNQMMRQLLVHYFRRMKTQQKCQAGVWTIESLQRLLIPH